MAKRQATNRRNTRTSTSDTGTARLSDDQLRAKGFVPFLRPEHCGNGEQLEMTGFNSIRDRGTEREQFTCEVVNEKGQEFLFGVREGSPDHRKLFKVFGANYRDWRGTVVVEIGTGSRGGSFVNIGAVSDNAPDWADTTPASETE